MSTPPPLLPGEGARGWGRTASHCTKEDLLTNETDLEIQARAALDPAEVADVRRLAERGQASGVEPRVVWRALTDASRATISHLLCRRAAQLLAS